MFRIGSGPTQDLIIRSFMQLPSAPCIRIKRHDVFSIIFTSRFFKYSDDYEVS